MSLEGIVGFATGLATGFVLVTEVWLRVHGYRRKPRVQYVCPLCRFRAGANDVDTVMRAREEHERRHKG